MTLLELHDGIGMLLAQMPGDTVVDVMTRIEDQAEPPATCLAHIEAYNLDIPGYVLLVAQGFAYRIPEEPNRG